MGLGMIISGALGYIQTVAMTHMVSRSTYGIFLLVYTMAVFISQLTKLGLDGVLLRFLPAYRAREERRLAAGLALFSFWVPAAVGLACALGLSLLANPIARGVFHNAAYATPMREASLIIPLNGLLSVVLNGLQAIKVVKWQVYVGRVIEPVATLTLLALFYLIGFRLDALIFAYVFSLLLSVIVGRIAFKRLAGNLIHAEPEYVPGEWMRFGAAMLFNVMTIAVIQSTDVLGVGAFDTAGQVSLYGAADRIGSLIAMPFFALNIVFTPMISEMYARREMRQLERMFALVTRWSFAVSWPICLCCVIYSAPILGIFGKGYVAGSTALVILAAGSIINAGTGPVNSILIMTGQLRVLWFNTSLRLVANVALVLLLIPRYGILGAALASSLTVALLNAVCLAQVWWIMKIQPYRWEVLKPLAAGGAAAVVGLVLMYLTQAGTGVSSSITDFFASVGLVLAFLAVYMFGLMRLGLTEEDRQVFEAVRAKFFRT
jgi:O-antigen/teichoic acid export membrane protein